MPLRDIGSRGRGRTSGCPEIGVGGDSCGEKLKEARGIGCPPNLLTTWRESRDEHGAISGRSEVNVVRTVDNQAAARCSSSGTDRSNLFRRQFR